MVVKRTSTVAVSMPAGAVSIAVMVGGLFGLQPAFAQDPGSVTIDAGSCIELESAAERLACFDAQSRAAIEARDRARSDDTAPIKEREDSTASAAVVSAPARAVGRDARERAERNAANETERDAARLIERETEPRAERGADARAERSSANRRAERDAELSAAGETDRGAEPDADRQPGRRRARGSAETEPTEASYSGTITAVRERLPQSYIITLDNGQVWEQTEPKRYPLRPGLEVTISESRWGDSYRLSGSGTGSFIVVRRVR